MFVFLVSFSVSLFKIFDILIIVYNILVKYYFFIEYILIKCIFIDSYSEAKQKINIFLYTSNTEGEDCTTRKRIKKKHFDDHSGSDEELFSSLKMNSKKKKKHLGN